jgi:hypothetical protein
MGTHIASEEGEKWERGLGDMQKKFNLVFIIDEKSPPVQEMLLLQNV